MAAILGLVDLIPVELLHANAVDLDSIAPKGIKVPVRPGIPPRAPCFGAAAK